MPPNQGFHVSLAAGFGGELRLIAPVIPKARDKANNAAEHNRAEQYEYGCHLRGLLWQMFSVRFPCFAR